ncbi:MAG: hypothetical protein LUG13_00120 [Oscillospiraceae bacterium]|nr:hypothetical protein [Oscillospiraceae bacterium]
MPDYKKMYLTLVDEVSNTIDRLTAVLQKAEEIYIESDDTEIQIADFRQDKEKQPPHKQ